MEAKSTLTVHILVAGLLILLVSPALSLRAQSPQVRILSNNYTPCATDVYRMKFPTRAGMPEDPQTGLQFEDFAENDSVMTRLPKQASL